jgi:hypothetical protein
MKHGVRVLFYCLNKLPPYTPAGFDLTTLSDMAIKEKINITVFHSKPHVFLPSVLSVLCFGHLEYGKFSPIGRLYILKSF